MFDNNNKVLAYKIALKLDPYLVALFHLCYDVFLKLESITENEDEILHATRLFKDTFYDNLNIIPSGYLIKDEHHKYIYSKEVFFNDIASNLNNTYLRDERFISKLIGKEYLYYFKDSSTIYSTFEKGKALNNLNDKFKTINVISDLLGNLENQILQDSIKSIATIYDFNKAGQYIKIVNDDFFKPTLFCLNTEYLNAELIYEEPFDFDKVWINYKHPYCKELVFDLENDEYTLVFDKDSRTVIGLKVNDKILLKYNVEIGLFVKKEFRNVFLWRFFKENLFRGKISGNISTSPLIEDFKKLSGDAEFNQLLCNLQHNLYVDKGIVIKDDFSKFFEEFILIKGLSELSNFNMFLPNENCERDLLAIYAEQKIGKKYNLLHHLKHVNDKSYLSNVNSTPVKKEKVVVNILKVELSFYFVEKYYEDIIEALLKELDLKYLTNVELCLNGVSKAEFDFIIFKNDQFYFIEAKTTLSKDNVYQTSKKYNQSIDYLKLVVSKDLSSFRFLLFGLLSSSNIDNYKHFFMPEDIDYNVDRENFKVTPYKFAVPFFNHQDLVLECIAEPEILKLKEYIKETCQI